MVLKEYIEKIEDVSKNHFEEARKREDALIKPPHSLGVLEDIACKLCAIKKCNAGKLEKKRILVFASDNGVVAENVSSAPKKITYEQCINMTKAITGASSMAKEAKVDFEVIDVGVDFDFNKYYENDKSEMIFHKVIDKKIAYGTKNLLKEDAMTNEECEKAIMIGFESAKKAHDENIDIIGIGEMGIGNTTTSSAVLSAISGIEPSELTGRGGGLTDEAYVHKIDVIEEAIERYKNKYKSDVTLDNTDIENRYKKVTNVLSSLGGFDIAAMVGAYIGAAYYKIPVVIDGFISVVAAYLAFIINDKSRNYMFASHKSKEIGYNFAIEKLGLIPMFDLQMRLGEGSGCILAFKIIESAIYMHKNMATFSEAKIDDTYLKDIRKCEF